MLADFGFTKFEKDIVGHNTTHLLGGTRTYGELQSGIEPSFPMCMPKATLTFQVPLNAIPKQEGGRSHLTHKL